MMLKQSSSRNLRAKSLKVKHVLQILLLLAICIWLLYQVNKSYNKKKGASEERAIKVSENGENEYLIMKMGRKQLKPRVDEMASEVELEDEESKVRENEGDENVIDRDEEIIDAGDKEKIDEEGERDPLQDFVDEDDKDAQEK